MGKIGGFFRRVFRHSKAPESSTSQHVSNREQSVAAPISPQNNPNSPANSPNSQFPKSSRAPSEPRPLSSRSLPSATAAALQTAVPITPPATSSATVEPAKDSTQTSLVQGKQTTPVQGVAVVSALVTTQGSTHQASTSAPTCSSRALAAVWQQSIQIAQKRLSEENLPPLSLDDQTSQAANDAIKLTIGDLQSIIKRNAEKDAWVGRLQKILKTMEKYAKIVDTAIQYNPQFPSLVWAGIRAILEVRPL